MSIEVCESCGEYFSDQDMLPTGTHDAGGVAEPTFICAGCAHSAEVDNYWQEQSAIEQADEPEKRNP